MSVRHLLNPSSLACRQFMISPVTPRLLPSFAAANSLLSRSYPAFKNRPPRNEEIKSLCREIEFIDAAGKYQGFNSLESVLSMMDREIYHLVSVNPHVAPEPVLCKLISKQQIEEDERAAYLTRKMKKQSSKNPSKTVKTVEISWATAPNDLGHKLKRVDEFLQKGYRVEVVLGVKKGMAKQPLRKMEEMVQQIREESTKSGKEWKQAEGNVGVQYMIYLEGRLPKKNVEPKILGGAGATEGSKTGEVAEKLEAGVETGVVEEMGIIGGEMRSIDAPEETKSGERRRDI